MAAVALHGLQIYKSGVISSFEVRGQDTSFLPTEEIAEEIAEVLFVDESPLLVVSTRFHMTFSLLLQI